MWVWDAWCAALDCAAWIVVACSVVSAFTRTPRDDGPWGRAYRVVEILAFNFGRAKETPPNRRGGRFVAW